MKIPPLMSAVAQNGKWDFIWKKNKKQVRLSARRTDRRRRKGDENPLGVRWESVMTVPILAHTCRQGVTT